MLTVDQLAVLIERPEVVRLVLQGYQGPYSLGVTEREGQPALLLRKSGEHPQRSMRTVTLEGDKVPLLIEEGMQAPRPLETALGEFTAKG